MSITAVPKRGPGPATVSLTGRYAPGAGRTGTEQVERPGLDTSPEVISALATGLAQAASEVGVTEQQQSADLVIPVDSRASPIADLIVRQVSDSSLLGVRSGLVGAEQKDRLRKSDALLILFGNVVTGGADVDDSLCVLGDVQRIARDELERRLLAAAGHPMLNEAEDEWIRSNLKALQAMKQKIAKAPADLAQKTARATRRHQARLAQMGDHTALMETIIDQHNGVPVSEQRMAEAVQSYQKYQAQTKAASVTVAAPKNRRTKGR